MCDIDKTKGTFSLGPDSSVRSERKKQIASSAAIDFIHGSDLKDFCCPIDPKMEHTNIWVMCIYIYCVTVFSFGPPPPPPPSFPFPYWNLFGEQKSRRGRLQRGPEPALRIIKSTSDIQGDDETGIETELKRKYNGRGEYMCMMLVAFVIGYIHKRNVRKEPKLWNGRGLSPGRRDNLLRDRTKSN